MGLNLANEFCPQQVLYTVGNSQDTTVTICTLPAWFHSRGGLYISSTFSWVKQCEEVKKKASRILDVLQRNLLSCSKTVKERAHMGLVRLIAEYATAACSPHTKKDACEQHRRHPKKGCQICLRRLQPYQQCNINHQGPWLVISAISPHGARPDTGVAVIAFPSSPIPHPHPHPPSPPNAEPGPANNIIEHSSIHAPL